MDVLSGIERRREVSGMDKEQIEEFVDALLEFVKWASKKGATAEEVEALPEVARVLADFNQQF